MTNPGDERIFERIQKTGVQKLATHNSQLTTYSGDPMFTNIHIKKHERGLLFRRGDFVRLLRPGTYRFWDLLGRTKVAVVSTLETNFKHPLLDVLLLEPSVQDELLVLDLADGERAIVWKDERLAYVLGTGRHALWLASGKLRVERFDISQFRFEHPKLSLILQNGEALKFLEGVMVDANQEVLLYRDGVLIGRLSEGLHVFWKGTGKVAWKTIDRREQVIDVAGQEILTSDKVTLRVNLLVTYQVIDPVRAVTAVSDAAQTLYREAQLVLRKAIGTKPLDALLADKEAIGAQVREALVERAAEMGLCIRSIGLRDIILPGDMKTLLNQVIGAQKEAEANLIRRREETASVRSQANTAKLLADNPQLARLKELEVLQTILAGAKTTFVFGAQGDIVQQVRG